MDGIIALAEVVAAADHPESCTTATRRMRGKRAGARCRARSAILKPGKKELVGNVAANKSANDATEIEPTCENQLQQHPQQEVDAKPILPLPTKTVGKMCVKTKFCRFFGMGRCTKGEECTYAHARSELCPKPDYARTKICPAVAAGGNCGNILCNYAHKRAELRSLYRKTPNRQSGSSNRKTGIAASILDPTSSSNLHVPLPVGLVRPADCQEEAHAGHGNSYTPPRSPKSSSRFSRANGVTAGSAAMHGSSETMFSVPFLAGAVSAFDYMQDQGLLKLANGMPTLITKLRAASYASTATTAPSSEFEFEWGSQSHSRVYSDDASNPGSDISSPWDGAENSDAPSSLDASHDGIFEVPDMFGNIVNLRAMVKNTFITLGPLHDQVPSLRRVQSEPCFGQMTEHVN